MEFQRMQRAAARISARTLCASLALSATALGQFGTTERISSTAAGLPGNGSSAHAVVSGDGRWVAFDSQASDLVAGDTNQERDVFLCDLTTHTLELVSVASSGVQGNGASSYPSLSSDGRFVAFVSVATSLVGDDTNDRADVFVRDRQLGITLRVSLAFDGSEANSHCLAPSISAAGQRVAFLSDASNLVPLDTNARSDVFVRDTDAGTTARISDGPLAVEADQDSARPVISADGNSVAFESLATNLVAGDTLFAVDVFVRDLTTGLTVLASANSNGEFADHAAYRPRISADGRFVVFDSAANNLGGGDPLFDDVFLRDLLLQTTTCVSSGGGGGHSREADVSDDGRRVLFRSAAALLPADTNPFDDLYLRDVESGALYLESVNSAGEPQSGNAGLQSDLSADGQLIAFSSDAQNLAPGDTGTFYDIFLRDLSPAPERYCTAKLNSAGCLPVSTWSGSPSLSASAPFLVGATQVINNKVGYLYYGFGPRAAPFRGGTLCVAPPQHRTGLQVSGGNAGADDCSGVFSFDFTALIDSGVEPALTVGRSVYCQHWFRDPPSLGSVGLSDGLSFLIQP